MYRKDKNISFDDILKREIEFVNNFKTGIFFNFKGQTLESDLEMSDEEFSSKIISYSELGNLNISDINEPLTNNYDTINKTM